MMRAFGSAKRMPFSPARQQERAHGGRLADAQGRDRAADELHGVVDRQAGGHDAAGRVDVEGDFLLRVLGFEEQQLRHDQRGRIVFDRAREEDDPLAQEARIDVERALAAVRLLDHHRDERIVKERSTGSLIVSLLLKSAARMRGRQIDASGETLRDERYSPLLAFLPPLAFGFESASSASSSLKSASLETVSSSTFTWDRIWSTTFSSNRGARISARACGFFW